MKPLYGHSIRMLYWANDQAMTATLATMDLTASQGRILAFIAHSPQPPCPRDMEEAFHLTHPTVSGLLSRLEKKGFIRIDPDPADRRCKRVSLDVKGRECLAKMDATIASTSLLNPSQPFSKVNVQCASFKDIISASPSASRTIS